MGTLCKSAPVGGIRSNGNSLEFYTSGADRLTLPIDVLVNELSKQHLNLPDGLAFTMADYLWNNFMENVASEIVELGGSANVGTSITNRPNWQDVVSAINNGNPLPINCN